MIHIVLWIVLGAVAGWVSSLLTRTTNTNENSVKEIGIGVIGAVLVGFVTQSMIEMNVGEPHIASLLMAAVGAFFCVLAIKVINNNRIM